MATVILLLATLIPIPEPQVERVKISATSTGSFAFDWDGKSADGTSHTLPIVQIVFLYTGPGAPPEKRTVLVATTGPIPVGQNKVPLRQAVIGIPAGDWDVQVALKDEAGQVSGFSPVTPSSQVEVFVNPPSAPQNVGVVE